MCSIEFFENIKSCLDRDDHLIFNDYKVIMMFQSEVKRMDEILFDTIRNGIITDIFGFRGVGKTQLALQISLNLLKNGKNVSFIDTTGEFRPERLLEIVKNRDLDESLLNHLQVARVTNTNEQIELLQKIEKINGISMLVVDNIADLFSFEYSEKKQFYLQQNKFMNYMHDLSQLAINRKIPVIITNQLMETKDHAYEKMENSIKNYTHQKIKLEKHNDHFQGRIFSPFSKKIEFFYTIEKTGLVERS